MTRLNHGLLAVTLLLLAPPLLLTGSTASAMRYFVGEYVDEEGDSVAMCMEFSSDSFEIESSPCQLEEVTEAELEAMGLLTSEQQQADAEAHNWKYVGNDKRGHSWIRTWMEGSRAYSYCGSESFLTSGVSYLRVHGTRINKTRSTQTGGTAVDGSGTRVVVWWRNTHIPPPYYQWQMLGEHKFARGGDEYTTDVSCWEP